MEKFPISNTESFEDSKSSEQNRQELAALFMEELNNAKKMFENDSKLLELQRKIAGDSFVEANKGLDIFRSAVQAFSKDARIPEKFRMSLKYQLANLTPIGSEEVFPGVSNMSTYTYAIDSIIQTLDGLLAPEVSLAIKAYASKIFLPPVQAYIESKDLE